MQPSSYEAARFPQVDALTLDECVGQVLCFGWDGDDAATVNDHALEIVEQMGVGAVMLLGRNVRHPCDTRMMLDELRQRSRIPLLAAIDHEGGSVCRFRSGLHIFPGNMALGAIADLAEAEALTERQTAAQGDELRAAGIDWNCAPVADVNSNPHNPVIGVRSFGESPQRVAALVRAAVRGFRRSGLLACAKHFPGHGDTVVDSHLGLPTVARPMASLEQTELVPFQAAVSEGVGAIMTSHIVFPAFDPDRPATCSPAILTGLLRGNLGFDGLIMTDCLEMAASADTIGCPSAAVQALRAGADMVLLSHTLAIQREVARAIGLAVESGVLPETRLREAASRVLRAKQSTLSRPRPDGAPWERPEHSELEDTIAAKSVTLVRGAIASVDRASSIAVVSVSPVADTLAEALRDQGARRARACRMDPQTASTSSRSVPQNVLSADHVVVLTDSRPALSSPSATIALQVDVVRRACRALGDRLTVVATREPYDLILFPEVRRYLCTYSLCTASMRALATILLGDARPEGRLPVSLPATN